jgi:hypothetical protein
MRTRDDIISRNIIGPDGGLGRGLRGKCKKLRKKKYRAVLMFYSFLEE